MKAVHAAECRMKAQQSFANAMNASTTAKAVILLAQARCLLAQAAAIESIEGDPA